MSALCARLRARVDHVTLNVRADNTAAVRLYERLGFTRVADFTECGLRRRA
ncbi:GNAT family N-acetyltransferase [Micromonospora olivasterospora]|uniref:FR47-like protein n=1 Tax=Micromonospora olivasterospora TaxID=1880 RepID=A0A562IHK0_MICOL|nr:GNAT family N-acetyltransferase [Micromonospora olivasterospora]TWH70286.1 FR47-like protein [Micromonospora olivasterospora]